MTGDYQIRAMSRSELELAIGWARDEGWNPGLHDATPFHAADPEGFLVGVLDGRPISSISVVRYGETFGFLGFYIVIPEERGRGYGYPLWQAGMARLAGRLVGLDGVPAQQDNYRRSGFELAYRNVRYGGTAPAGRASGLRDARTVPFEQLLAFDARLFPAPRPGFLAGWISLPESRALAARGRRRAARLRRASAVRERPQDRAALRDEPRNRGVVVRRALRGASPVSRSSSTCRSPTRRRSPWPKDAISRRRSRPPGCTRARPLPSSSTSSSG